MLSSHNIFLFIIVQLISLNIYLTQETSHSVYTQLSFKSTELLNEFLGSEIQGEFFKDYVPKRLPIKIKGVYDDKVDAKDVINTSQAITTYFDVFDGNKLSRISARETMLMVKKNTPITVNMNIPNVLKAQLLVPKFLLCGSALSHFQHSKLRFDSRPTTNEITVEQEEDVLMCVLNGNVQVQLIDLLGVSRIKSNSDDAQKDNYQYHTTLESGDCIYRPKQWFSAWLSSMETIVISISWKNDDVNTSNAASSICEKRPDKYIISLDFQKESKPDILPLLKFHKLHHVIESYFLYENGHKMTFQKFEEQLKQDEYIAGIMDWNEECSSIANEMFEQLDQNLDGQLSLSDFSINQEDMEHLAGQMSDRYQDFQDILKDQQREKKPFTNAAREALSKTEEEIRNELQQEFKELFMQIEELTNESEKTRDEKNEPALELIRDEKISQSTKDEL